MHKILLIPVLLAFSALTALALWRHGYWGLFEGQFQTWAGAQVLADLAIALSLVLVWLWRDAQAHGRSVWPWVLLTLATGSFGPLLYLLTRPASTR